MSGRLKALDGWRGVSVLLVIFSHLIGNRYAGFFDTGAVSVHTMMHMGYPGASMIVKVVMSQLLVPCGSLGVRVFFIISGFIITHLLLREESRFGRVSIVGFFRRRIFRIIPALYIFLIFMALFDSIGLIPVSSLSIAHSSLFLCDMTGFECIWPIGHTWSLAVEEQFYLVWPFLFVLMPVRLRFPLALCALVVGVVLAQLATFQKPFFNLPLSFACIAAGACVSLSSAIQAAIATKVNSFIYAVCMVIIFFQPVFHFIAPRYSAVIDVLSPLLMCIIIFKPLFCEGRMQKVLEKRPLVLIGALSYSIYLWQQPFTGAPGKYLVDSPLQFFFLLIVPAVFSYYCIEQPFIRFGKNFFDLKSAPTAL